MSNVKKYQQPTGKWVIQGKKWGVADYVWGKFDLPVKTTRFTECHVTIDSVHDGRDAITYYLQNQNHSFPADSLGAVLDEYTLDFSTLVLVFSGDTQLALDNSSDPAKGTYAVDTSSLGSSAAGWSAEITPVEVEGVGEVAEIRLDTINQSIDSRSAVITVPLVITPPAGSKLNTNLKLTLTKVVHGRNVSSIEFTSDRQTFYFNTEGVTADDPIHIGIKYAGDFVGQVLVEKSIDGGSWTSLNEGNTEGYASVMNIMSGGEDSIVITSANFGSSKTFTIRVSDVDRAASKVISLVRTNEGKTGAAELAVYISALSNGTVFRNNSYPQTKTLEASVVDSATGLEVTENLSYQWFKSDEPISGATSKQLTITVTEIPKAGSLQYSCEVIVEE